MIVVQVLAGLRLPGVHPTHLVDQPVPDLLHGDGLELVPFGVQAVLHVSPGDLALTVLLEDSLVVLVRLDVA